MDLEGAYAGEKHELKTDGAFIFISFEPNNQLVPAGTRMNADGYMVTNEKCETNIAGIFAIIRHSSFDIRYFFTPLPDPAGPPLPLQSP
jgi:thioredoxin reductase